MARAGSKSFRARRRREKRPERQEGPFARVRCDGCGRIQANTKAKGDDLASPCRYCPSMTSTYA